MKNCKFEEIELEKWINIVRKRDDFNFRLEVSDQKSKNWKIKRVEMNIKQKIKNIKKLKRKIEKIEFEEWINIFGICDDFNFWLEVFNRKVETKIIKKSKGK